MSSSHQSEEQKFLDWFGRSFPGRALSSIFSFGALSFHCTSFSETYNGESIGGHGHSLDPSIAALKAAAEIVERRTVLDFYRKNPHPVASTNGWAVGFSKSKAENAAKREALERHILLYTFLSEGWSGFSLVDHRQSAQGDAWFLLSPYLQNGYSAGIVVYKSPKFPGVSFGHFSDEWQRIQTSDRWDHALFEAVGFSERIAETGGVKAYDDSIYASGGSWLEKTWVMPLWKTSYVPVHLPEFSVEVDSWRVPGDSGLHVAHCQGEKLLPLFLLEDLAAPQKRAFVEEKLKLWNLRMPEEKMPIL